MDGVFKFFGSFVITGMDLAVLAEGEVIFESKCICNPICRLVIVGSLESSHDRMDGRIISNEARVASILECGRMVGLHKGAMSETCPCLDEPGILIGNAGVLE